MWSSALQSANTELEKATQPASASESTAESIEAALHDIAAMLREKQQPGESTPPR
jgi:hypothetical protein